jgi:alpha-mannosidase
MDTLEGAQLPGRRHVDYALLPHRGDWQDADLYAAADAFLVPLERARVAATTGEAPASGQVLRVEGAEVSAVTREPGGLTVRVFNATPAPSTVALEHEGGPASGWLVDLLGRPLEPFDGGFPLRAWGIATARLTP